MTKDEQFLRLVLRDHQSYLHIRPAVLSEFLIKFRVPAERRRIFSLTDGRKFFIEPLSNLGQTLLNTGTYEPDTEALIRRHVRSGDITLDIGANEGYFTLLLAQLAGPSGLVIAAEPQSRLQHIIQINAALNGLTNYRLYNKALGKESTEIATLNLASTLNTGSSSILTKAKLNRNSETIEFITPDQIMQEAGINHIDFIKIDVEGFEVYVIEILLPLIRQRKIGKILCDYHKAILVSRGFDWRNTDQSLMDAGMMRCEGDVDGGGYVLYELNPGAPSAVPL